MKNLTITFALVLATIFTAFAGTNPVHEVTLFESEVAAVTIDGAHADFFTIATYNEMNDSFVFQTEGDISFIQIFNEEGTLEFQLPVMSNKVTIGKSIMNQGNYKLGFMIQGSTDIQFTNVSVK